MLMTFGNWFFVGVVFIIGVIVSIFLHSEDVYREKNFRWIINILITIFVCAGCIFAISWYHKNTANGIRSYKDFQSNIENGIDREIIITAEDGREIFRYEGKVDIESNHEDNYIKFESEDGRRYMIYYGIQDTIQIIEKEE